MNPKSAYFLSGLFGAHILAVAPAAVVAEESDASDSITKDQSNTLRILNYNIHHGVGLDGQLDLKRIAKVIADQKPDIVTLQEVDVEVVRSGGVDQVAELAGLLQFNHIFGKAMDYQGGEYGNAILSRFPLELVQVHPLSGGNEGRCALEVRVKIPRGEITEVISVVTAHLDLASKATETQAAKLARLAISAEKPVILTGDFNSIRDSAALRNVEEFFTLPPSAGGTSPSDNPKKEIDYIIPEGFPEEGELTVIKEILASDHRPVLMVIPRPMAKAAS